MNSTAGSQRKAVVGERRCLAQDMPWSSHGCRCWRTPRNNNLCKKDVKSSNQDWVRVLLLCSRWLLQVLTLAWANTLSGDVQTLAAGNGLQLAFIAICDTI